MSPIFIVSLPSNSRFNGENRLHLSIKRAFCLRFALSLHRDSENNKFNNKKLKKGNKLWQRM